MKRLQVRSVRLSDYVLLLFLMTLASADQVSEEVTVLTQSVKVKRDVFGENGNLSAPYNLTATVLLVMKHIEVNISWNPPIDRGKTKFYEIYLTPISEQCSSYSQQMAFAGENDTYAILPNSHNGKIRDASLPRNCTFLAKVVAMPTRMNAELIFRVENCLPGGDCPCREQLAPPSELSIQKSAEVESGNITVFWEYPSHEVNATYFIISFSAKTPGPPGKTPGPSLMYRKYQQAKLLRNETIEQYSKSLNTNGRPYQKVTVEVFDSHHCARSLKELSFECSKGSCMCQAKALGWNNPTIDRFLWGSEAAITVFWSYPTHLLNEVDFFQIMVNNVSYKHYSDGFVNGSDIVPEKDQKTSFNFTYTCNNVGSNIEIIQIRAVDFNKCYSPASNEPKYHCRGADAASTESTVSIVNTDPTTVAAIVVSVLVIVVVAVAGIIVCLRRWRGKKGIFKNVIRSRPSLQSSTFDNRSQSSSIGEGSYYPHSIGSQVSSGTRVTYLPTELYQMSPIYVEREIMDAIADGKADSYEISFNRLRVGKEIGKGAFGRVFLAEAEAIAGRQGKMYVAVKQLNAIASDADKNDFLKEIEMMKIVGRHPNVVHMLACCTIQQPLCMVMEFVPCGDLRRYLQRLRKEYVRRSRILIPEEPPVETTALLAPEPPVAEPPKVVLPPQSPPAQLPSNLFLGHGESSEKLIRSPPSSPVNSTASSGGYISHAAVSGPESNNSGSCQLTTESNGPLNLNTYTINKSEGSEFGAMPHPGSIECVLDSEELYSFANQIALGMRHLASKHITHRDLAARNVLIDESKTLKISDFGLSRMGIYQTQRGGRVPLRWLSIEAIRFNDYSSASDVWAYGVVLWEICTLGGFPYPTIGDEELPKFLEQGRRLNKPDNCSQEMYDVMQKCWSSDPSERPSFDQLCTILDKISDEPNVYVNFDVLYDNPLPPSEEEVNRKKRHRHRSTSGPKTVL